MTGAVPAPAPDPDPPLGKANGAEQVPLRSVSSSLPALLAQGNKPAQHPGLVARLAEPPAKSGDQVGYSPAAGKFQALCDKALDLVEGPYSQRARRKARGETMGGAASYREVMSEIDRGAGDKLAKHLMARIVAAHQARGTMTAGSPGLQHLRTVDREALRTLEPWEQKLLTNGAGNLPAVWLDLDSAIHNGLSLCFHRAMNANGTIDAAKVAAELSPAAVDVLHGAEQQFAARDPVLQHWARERSAYEPDDRPVTKRDLQTLERQDRRLYQALLDAAPIPTSLPVLNASVAGDATRLDDCAVVMVQHALGSIVPFTQALMQKGVRPGDMEFVPVPYSTNAIVEQRLERQGLRVHDSCPDGVLAPRDVEKVMERDVLMALHSALQKSRVSRKKLVVIDDGGIVVRLLSGRAKTLGKDPLSRDPLDSLYHDVVEAYRTIPLRVVEQTTRGITEALSVGKLPPNITLVDMARSQAKAFEGPMVGKDAHLVLDRGMRDVGKGGIAGKHVALVGFGVIGGNVARALRDAGAIVTIYDADEETRARAQAEGFRVTDTLRAALAEQDLVVGASGHRSVQREDFYAMRRGTVLASLSSKAMELFTDHIDAWMSATMYPAQGHGEAPVARYGRAFQHHQIVDNDPKNAFGQTVYYLLNNGCPVTFTGHVNAVPPEDIQLTEAIKLESVLQAATSEIGLGIVALEDARQQRTLESMDRYRPGWR